MAEKAKPKPKRPRADEAGVLASLPTTRPNRLGRRNRGTAAPKLAAKTTAKAVAKAKPKARAKPKPKAVPAPTAIAGGQRPRPVRAGAKGLKTTKPAPRRTPEKAPSGTELVTTVVQAAGELAQVGLSIGGQVLKRAVERLPKP